MNQKEPIIFGNTLKQFKGACIVGGIFFAIALISAIIFTSVKKKPEALPQLAFYSVIAGLIVPAFSAPTLLFSLRFQDRQVSSLFLNKTVLSTGKIDCLERVVLGGGSCAVKLHFNDGVRVRLFGADVRILSAMCHHIMELRPEFTSFHINHALRNSGHFDEIPDEG